MGSSLPLSSLFDPLTNSVDYTVNVAAAIQSLSHVLLFATPQTATHVSLWPWDFPGKNPGVGCHFLFQGNFLTQGMNPSLLPPGKPLPYCCNHHCPVNYHLPRHPPLISNWSVFIVPGSLPSILYNTERGFQWLSTVSLKTGCSLLPWPWPERYLPSSSGSTWLLAW